MRCLVEKFSCFFAVLVSSIDMARGLYFRFSILRLRVMRDVNFFSLPWPRKGVKANKAFAFSIPRMFALFRIPQQRPRGAVIGLRALPLLWLFL
jgi:hypothetical protein